MDNFPKWAEFTPRFAAAELGRLLEASERSVAAIESSGARRTYESVVLALGDATRALERCWGMVMHLNAVMNAPAWRPADCPFT